MPNQAYERPVNALKREQLLARWQLEREQREQEALERKGMHALVDGAVTLANDTPEWDALWRYVGGIVRRITSKSS